MNLLDVSNLHASVETDDGPQPILKGCLLYTSDAADD